MIFVDFHAEATRKSRDGRVLDGKVTAVVGTHTHVRPPTSGVLPQGTYITDVGSGDRTTR